MPERSMTLRTAAIFGSVDSMNCCPPKPGIHGHQQHEVDLVEHVLEPIERRRRIEHEAALAAALANQLQRPVDVLARFGMKADVGRAGGGEIGNDAIDGLDHQMHVDRRLDAVLAQRFADQRPDREIRDVMVVHDVEMDEVGAGRDDGIDFLAETREVGRQDRRGYPAVTHNVFGF